MNEICEKHKEAKVRVGYEHGKTGMECRLCNQESKSRLHKLFTGPISSPAISRLQELRDKMNSSPGWQDELTAIIEYLLANSGGNQ